MAELCEKLGLETRIICIDTWLGSSEHWLRPDYAAKLRFRDGHPRLYEAFLENVRRSNVARFIHPLPLDSASASRVLASSGMRADMIYVDASHEYTACLADLKAFLPLLNDSGVLLGDDFGWQGVYDAVVEIVQYEPSLNAYACDGKYILSRQRLDILEPNRLVLSHAREVAPGRQVFADTIPPYLRLQMRLQELTLAKFARLKLSGRWNNWLARRFDMLK